MWPRGNRGIQISMKSQSLLSFISILNIFTKCTFASSGYSEEILLSILDDLEECDNISGNSENSPSVMPADHKDSNENKEISSLEAIKSKSNYLDEKSIARLENADFKAASGNIAF